MKIVYCLPQIYKPGGIERIVILKANYLASLGYDIHIITSEQFNKSIFYAYNKNIHFHDLSVNFSSTLSLPIIKRLIQKHQLTKIYKRKLTKLLMKLKADITISTFSHEANILPDIADNSIKIIETHFPKKHQKLMADTFNYPFFTKIAYYIKDWVEENIIAKKYDQMVVLTSTDAQEWKKITPNVIQIPNFITFNTEATSTVTNKRVLAVGHFSKIKAFEDLINIWALVKQKDINNAWILSIIGCGEDLQKIKDTIITLKVCNSVEILPPTDKIQQEYLSSSIYVSTSKYEGFPMVLLEAMQSGLPCIAFDCPNGPRDIITNNNDGFLVRPNDFNDFANKILLLMNNDKKRIEMGKNAAINIQRYSCDKIMKKWTYLFNNLIKDK